MPTSASMELARRAERGISTRLTCTSATGSGDPATTGKTGTPAPRSARRAGESPSGPLSPPSLTSTIPARGTPESSSRTRSSAWPRWVPEASKESASGPGIRSMPRPKAKNRTPNRSSRAARAGDASAKAAAASIPRGVPAVSGSAMLRESSTRTATKLRWGRVVDTTSAGRRSAKRTSATTPILRTPRITRSRGAVRARAEA
jgi:hypothetical protein